MSKKFETVHNNADKAYSDYRSAKQESKKGGPNFSSMAKYLKGKETLLLKNDLGLFEFPETWDIDVDNTSQKH